MALTYDTFESVSREIYVPKLVDNIYDKSALLKIMAMDNAVKVLGGTKIFEPLKYAKSTSVGVYDKYDTFDLTPPENVTKATYDWGHYFSSIVLAGVDEIENAGAGKVLDLLRIRFEDAEMALRDKLADDLYAGTDAKGIIGLSRAISDTTTTYAGITSSDFSGWVSGEDSTSHTSANMKDSTSTSYVLTLLQKAIRSATHLGQRPNLIITNMFIWDIIESVINANTQYNKTTTQRGQNIAAAGFQTIEYRGIPIVADEKAPDSVMYVLNTNYLNFRINPLRNFKFTGYKVPTNQDARVGQILLAAQLCVNNRRMHYKFDALPTT